MVLNCSVLSRTEQCQFAYSLLKTVPVFYFCARVPPFIYKGQWHYSIGMTISATVEIDGQNELDSIFTQ